jgi:hypothetical protein
MDMITMDKMICVGSDMCYNKVERNEVQNINKIEIPKEILSLHGYTPPTKPKGIV